jgi:hypothetical protein
MVSQIMILRYLIFELVVENFLKDCNRQGFRFFQQRTKQR